MRALVIEDEAAVARDVAQALSSAGFVVDIASEGEDAWYKGSVEDYDVAVLDLGLPRIDGLSVLKRWRGAQRTFPVLILSARNDWTEKVAGIEAGADDYLPKPFDPRELVARIRAVLRRQQTADVAPTTAYHFDGFRYDPSAAVLLDPQGQTVPLTAGELRLLAAFVKRPAQLLSRDQLLDLTQHDPAEHFDRAIDLSVSRLRRKLGAAGTGDSIETVRGLGYRFRATVTRQ